MLLIKKMSAPFLISAWWRYLISDKYEAAVELAEFYYKKGKRSQAIYILEKYRSRLADSEDPFLINKITNKLEFLRKATVLKSKPLKLEIALTDRCNLSCVMCLQHNRGKYDISERTCREIAALIPYLEVINWIGGEVFLSPYFESLFDEAARHTRLRQNIITNGLLINDAWAEKLARNNVSVAVSVDGFMPEIYERLRKGAKFDDLVAALTRLQKHFAAHPAADVPARLSLNFVLMKSNHKELESILDFAGRFAIQTIRVAPLLYFQPENLYHEQNIVSDPELVQWYINTAPRLLREAAAKNINMNLPDYGGIASQLYTDVMPRKRSILQPLNKSVVTCPYPWASFFADAEGRASPFCQCGLPGEDNIHQQTLTDIWNSDGMRRYRERAAVNDTKSLGCEKCVFNYYNFCFKLCDPLL